MNNTNAHNKLFDKLREEYPFFVYESFEINRTNINISICYHFNLSDTYHFKPLISIPVNDFVNSDNLSDDAFNNLAFHLGMVEMISYWKVSCAPKIIIKPFALDNKQKEWWKNLYFKGLGEFFFLNGIDADFSTFLSFENNTERNTTPFDIELNENNIIPVGGGKDSALTLNLLTEMEEDKLVFFLNPQHLATDIIQIPDKHVNSITATRTIAPELLSLNREGFLNGHTPFSAMLAFLSLILAALTKRKNIVLSNESSANESTVPNTEINHQYSKTFNFESDFRYYTKNYISKTFNYYSFLRPLNELQIAFLFTSYPHSFNRFRSCNVGSKSGVWCGQCSKCLFTYVLLSAFLNDSELLTIFGADLYKKENLKTYFEQLIGESDYKPFDCVGTLDDVNAAIKLALSKRVGGGLPYLLEYYLSTKASEKYKEINPISLLKQFNDAHFLTDIQVQFLKSKLNTKIEGNKF